jgi:DNA-directed RNA polymerase subunit RPC12/RpoP
MAEPDTIEDGADARGEAGGDESPQRRFPCAQCGGKLEFAPGADALVCPYCNASSTIPLAPTELSERDFNDEIERLRTARPEDATPVVKCGACAAEVTRPPGASAFACPFCGTNIVSQETCPARVRPDGVLPFVVPRQKAEDSYRAWLRSRWFAPNAIKTQAFLNEQFKGVYLPAWTFDAQARTWYTGQRGDYYYVMVPRTRTVNGRSTVVMVRERRTRWRPASGVVDNAFDDVLVPACKALPEKKQRALEPWDLKKAEPYRDEFLAGFSAQVYQVGLPEGFALARTEMEERIAATVRADIGGDEQRITSMNPQYRGVTFKHLLLPVWISAYRYAGKLYQCFVNARTGEVVGERPYSFWKIFFLVVTILCIVAVVVLLARTQGR